MGFLRIKTERGDRIFVSAALLIAIHLLWLKYLPQVNLWIAFVLSILLAAIIVKRG